MNKLALISLLTFVFHLVLSQSHCDIKEIFVIKKLCDISERPLVKAKDESDPVYILYSVNPVEGFNLRRDVYLRMAIFLRHLRKVKGYENSHLVLPVFHHLYHWKSQFRQSNMFWNHFFDLPSLKLFTNVLDMWEFFDIIRNEGKDYVEIGEVYKLQHFETMFENGVFVDKFEEAACTRHEYDNYHYMENYYNITEKTITCINFQGSAMLLKNILEEYKVENHKAGTSRIVLFAHAETALHEFFGDEEYWMARRSMRFNKNLQVIGNAYRADFLSSTDEKDKVQRPELWTDEKPYRGAVGGEYLCVHMRRADFLYGREQQLPSLRSIANQIKRALAELGLHKVFLSSDCSGSEFHDMRAFLRGVNLHKFKPPWEFQMQLGDGAVAIIDQIICSHARKFIGTFESTFTYRIYEEREILGFQQNMTFNTLCKRDDLIDCNRNSVWPIRY
ncbi:hypothetical protein PVAND_013211 [Polypedilum vanderplanki]|uniref:GDP-fucose protein O-fucosyltransferase 2 n=1 Tax=Polypedilum vanderplanki TaxID=319348 RepID=A0A9J6CPZ1_POLVA|nr:hypothetical protein PVAND_013211 [Polypedilum vanderplanki]